MHNGLLFLFFTGLLLISCSSEPKLDDPIISIVSKPNVRFVHYNTNIGDVHPVYFNDNLYMYYLKIGGAFQSSMVKSNNLVSFKQSQMSTDPLAKPYSVLNVFQKNGSNEYVSYHATDGVIGNGILKGSKSTDLINWKLLGDEFIVREPAKKYFRLRDPYVFWNEDTNNYWAVRSGKEFQNGAWEFLYYTSVDLTNWEDKGTLYKTNDVYGDIECPQMFKMGDYWYLLYSEYTNRVGKPQYFVSSNAEGPYQKVTGDNSLDGSDNCAAQVVNVNGNWLLYGWVPSKDVETIGYQEWGGALTLPRVLSQDIDGRLTTRLEPSVSGLLRGDKSFELSKSIKLVSESTTLVSESLTGRYEKCNIESIFNIDAKPDAFGVMFEMGNGTSQVKVEINQQMLIVKTGSIIHSSILMSLVPGNHKLQIIYDKDIIECFVDNKFSLSAMVSKDIVKASIKPYVVNGSVTFSEFAIFDLKNLNALN